MSGPHYTYILASKRRGALFVGSTRDLADCVLEHKANLVDGLTSLYAIHMLVYYEVFPAAGPALLRQAELRQLHRRLKLHLIEQLNPGWHDLYDFIVSNTSNRSEAPA
ncbi:MAG: GIY-YIG nuclease family protein [Gammaproteobacteria bacterium]|nr:GIY-YIG nuclease family protein [Gammaproteobacteria bacterium]